MISYSTYADVLRPAGAKTYPGLYDMLLVVGGTLLVALAAQVSIPLPFSPVPVTGQTFAVLLVGALLGWRRGALCLIAYIGQGAAGLPVFAGGTAGLIKLLGPTGGYLVGFVLAAALVGWLAQRGWDRRVLTTFLAMLLGNGVIYLIALPWLALFVGSDKVLALGLYPFISGDLMKSALAAVLLPSAWKLVGPKS